jgi:peptidoglycan/LPS O-acetylase OafA/YrhL
MISEQSNNIKQIESIQVLRGIAAMLVFLGHVIFFYPLPFNIYYEYGVDLFFSLSGFMMMYVTQDNAHNFFKKRIIRILPLYWAITIASFFSALIAKNIWGYGLANTESDTTLTILIQSLTFSTPLFSKNLSPIISVGWTLNYEMMFYLLFWVSSLISIKYRALICMGLLALYPTLFGALGLVGYDPLIVWEFACGFGIFYILKFLSDIKASNKLRILCLFICTCSVACLLFLPMEIHRFFAAEPFVVLFFISFVTLAKGIKFTKIPVLLGDMSYSIYLLHSSISVFVLTIFIKLFDASYTYASQGQKLLTNPWLAICSIIIIIVLTLGSAFVSYKLIECKLTHYLRKKIIK